MAETPEDKKFRIQMGVARRLNKEHKCYIDETLRGTEEINVMKNSPNPDREKLKKMAECVEESRRMITDSSRRLAEACEQLRLAILATGRSDEDEKVTEARALIQLSHDQVVQGHLHERSGF